MSEPFSSVLQVKISKPQLLAYFASAPLPASHWTDWAETTRHWNRFNPVRELPPLIAEANRRLTGSYSACIRALLNKSPSTRTRLQYDHTAGVFTFANLEFSENMYDFITFLAVTRGIAPFMSGSDEGFAILRNYLWGDRRETLAALGLGAGISRFLNNPENVDAYEASIRRGTLLLDDILNDIAKREPNHSNNASNAHIEDLTP